MQITLYDRDRATAAGRARAFSRRPISNCAQRPPVPGVSDTFVCAANSIPLRQARPALAVCSLAPCSHTLTQILLLHVCVCVCVCAVSSTLVMGGSDAGWFVIYFPCQQCCLQWEPPTESNRLFPTRNPFLPLHLLRPLSFAHRIRAIAVAFIFPVAVFLFCVCSVRLQFRSSYTQPCMFLACSLPTLCTGLHHPPHPQPEFPGLSACFFLGVFLLLFGFVLCAFFFKPSLHLLHARSARKGKKWKEGMGVVRGRTPTVSPLPDTPPHKHVIPLGNA